MPRQLNFYAFQTREGGVGEDQGDTEAEEGKDFDLVSRGLVSALWPAEL